MNKFRAGWLLVPTVITALVLAGCDKGKTPPADTATPVAKTETAPAEGVIRFTSPGLYPEGLEYDTTRNSFLVTSMREGTVGAVTREGKYTEIIRDPRFISAVGIRVDAVRDRVLVCNSDPGAGKATTPATQGKLAALGVFRLSTGEALAYVDLARLGGEGGHFCNDIAIDPAGNAYVTDSFSPIIYRVDNRNRASVLLNDKRFTGESFNLNGIVYKDNYLIVAKMNEGVLFKVPLNKPKDYVQIKLAEPITGVDGLLWGPGGSLIAIANGKTNKVFKLITTDDWDSAVVETTVRTGEVFATTGVMHDGKVYVLNAMLHVMFNPETKEHVKTFEIHQRLPRPAGAPEPVGPGEVDEEAILRQLPGEDDVPEPAEPAEPPATPAQ